MNSRPSLPRRQQGAAATWVFLTFAAIALFFLVTEHRAHLYGWLPYLLIAACPLMHLFGHGGHGHGGGSRADESQRPQGGTGDDPSPQRPAHHHH